MASSCASRRYWRLIELCLANIGFSQKSLTSASPVGTLPAMRAVIKTGAAFRPAGATRRDFLLEALALRHQLAVLARSKRRFRQADRLFWLLLRWWWPRWREALVVIQPATVARWHREGVRGCWRHRSRRPGRPRIDSPCRNLIQRMAAENCLWGAPRIHGEWLKLGITISERTVSRYLRRRPTTRSQTWRTFLANHLGGQTRTSPPFAHAHEEDMVVDASDRAYCPALSIDAPGASCRRPSVDGGRSLQPQDFGVRLGRHGLQDHTGARKSSGRAPPRLQRAPHGFSLTRAANAVATDGRAVSICPRALGPLPSLA